MKGLALVLVIATIFGAAYFMLVYPKLQAQKNASLLEAERLRLEAERLKIEQIHAQNKGAVDLKKTKGVAGAVDWLNAITSTTALASNIIAPGSGAAVSGVGGGLSGILGMLGGGTTP